MASSRTERDLAGSRGRAEPGRSHLLDALQGLRALAALLVVVDHALGFLTDKGGETPAVDGLGYFLGNFGVHVFFVISGFIMMFTHGDDFGKPRAGLVFMIKRVSKIVPLYWITTMVAYGKDQALHGAAPLVDLLKSLVFIPYQGPVGDFGDPVYVLGWTLNYEMAFYLVFALGLMLPRARGLMLIAGSFLVVIAVNVAGVSGAPLVGFLGNPIVLYFLGGMALALVRKPVTGVLRFGFGAAVAAVAFFAGTAIAAAVLGDPRGLPSQIMTPLCIFAAAAGCCLATESDRRDLARTAARAVGDATYSIYLTHVFVLGIAGRALFRFFPGMATVLFVGTVSALATAVGILVYRSAERPLVRGFYRAMIGRFGDRPPRAAV
jgi:peptidoglycan/LPS O-acetylase OafA/YrhL